MKSPTIIVYLLCVVFSCSLVTCFEHEDFLGCLRQEFSSILHLLYTSNNSTYPSVLQFSIRNLRFASRSTPKPGVIITPEHESQIPAIIYCSKKNELEIRTRSGGHDYEGLSFVAQAVPFVIVDLINMSEVDVDVDEKSAWVGAGATIGSLYYRIAEKSPTLGFPAGVCPTVGVGGHISGGGYGLLHRKYGLAADNIIDARIANANGQILDRKSMGENLFWAIRGGGGASFGIILAWKVQLVDVPKKVTVFAISRTLEQNASQLVHRWQYVAPKLPKDLFLMLFINQVNSNQTHTGMGISASFFSLFLGQVDQMLALMQERFPELGLVRQDCTEMSWIQASVHFPTLAGYISGSLEDLLNRTQPNVLNYKAKVDYVKKPIPIDGLQGIWRFLYKPEAKVATVVMVPYGGRMEEIPESTIPFPHRAGVLFQVQYLVYWNEENARNSKRYFTWIRKLYTYMTSYASKSPREAYINYRDLDIGVNNVIGETSYAQANIWGFKYFKNNFNRLVQVKSIVDPTNYFRDEQSIPPIPSWES